MDQNFGRMTLFTGKHIIRLEEADSTNQVAQQMLGEQLPEGSVILAYHQTQGRGQQGNRWESPPGQNLTFSLVFYPTFLGVQDMFSLSKVAALGLHAALTALLPDQDIWVKWPNDILLNGRKVAGILIENQLQSRGLASTIIGIGLNVNQIQFMPALETYATSIKQETGTSQDIEHILQTLLHHLEGYYLQLQGSRSAIDRAYLQVLYGYQELTAIRIGQSQFQARVMGLDRQGRLGLLREGESSIRYYAVKEAHILLPGES